MALITNYEYGFNINGDDDDDDDDDDNVIVDNNNNNDNSNKSDNENDIYYTRRVYIYSIKINCHRIFCESMTFLSNIWSQLMPLVFPP